MGQEPSSPPTPGQEPGPGQEPTPSPTTPETPPAEPKTFDETYVKQLRTEAADWRTKAQAAETKVREFEDKDKSETERLAAQVQRESETRTAAERERDELRSRLDRIEIASQAGLDSFWADRLQGTSREELEADAKRIKEREGDNGRRGGDWDGGPRGGTPPALPDDADPLQRLTHAYGERK